MAALMTVRADERKQADAAVPNRDGQDQRLALAGVIWSDAGLTKKLASEAAKRSESPKQKQQLQAVAKKSNEIVDALDGNDDIDRGDPAKVIDGEDELIAAMARENQSNAKQSKRTVDMDRYTNELSSYQQDAKWVQFQLNANQATWSEFTTEKNVIERTRMALTKTKFRCNCGNGRNRESSTDKDSASNFELGSLLLPLVLGNSIEQAAESWGDYSLAFDTCIVVRMHDLLKAVACRY